MRKLLQRTKHWNDDFSGDLLKLVDRYGSCHATSRPKPSRKVNLSSIHRNFNDLICVDQFALGAIKIFHAIDMVKRYSAGLFCQDLSLGLAIHALEAVWLSPF